MPVSSVASRATACQARDDYTKESNDAIDDCGEHGANTRYNCHDDTADGSEDGLELFGDVVRCGSLFLACYVWVHGWMKGTYTRYDGTHCEKCLSVDIDGGCVLM